MTHPPASTRSVTVQEAASVEQSAAVLTLPGTARAKAPPTLAVTGLSPAPAPLKPSSGRCTVWWRLC